MTNSVMAQSAYCFYHNLQLLHITTTNHHLPFQPRHTVKKITIFPLMSIPTDGYHWLVGNWQPKASLPLLKQTQP